MYRKIDNAFVFSGLLAAAVFCGLASTSSHSEARSIAAPASSFINVNVSFDMQMPLADDEINTLSDAQTRGRKMIYRQAVGECPILLEAIAASCSLTRLNVSTRINRRNNNQEQFLHLNGNAQFAITLQVAE
jgi:hypothetical protein